MISALDTSVLIDVLSADPGFVASSRSALARASKEGALIVCPVVVAELRTAYRDDESVRALLLDLAIHVVDVDTADGLLARAIHRSYRHEGGARDRGFFRDRFDGPKVGYP